MYRWSLLALVFVSAVRAEEAPTRTLIRYEVEARSAPKPALRYQLLPELREIGPGTALQQYMKCFMEQNNFYYSKEANDEREKFLTMPLVALPLEKVRNYGGHALRNADRGARMERIEWQILAELKRDGFYALLPEVQKLRALAKALWVRMRGEIAQKKFDDAIGTAKTLLKMAHQLGDHPTLIGNLVGFALVAKTAQQLEEMLQQPGCPNLYWAFAGLPEPLVSLRAGIQAERMVLTQTLDVIGRDAPVTEVALDKAVAGLDKLFEESKLDAKIGAYLVRQAKDEKAVEAARKRLIDDGVKKEVVEKMPARQVIYLAETDEVKRQSDEHLKWFAYPYHKAIPYYAAQEKPKGILGALLPATNTVHLAQARTEQRLKMLQILEAIRLHAAAHKKELPAKLADIELPVPVDPMTGKAFRYSVEKGVATLTGTPPKGMEKVAVYNVVYEIKIVK